MLDRLLCRSFLFLLILLCMTVGARVGADTVPSPYGAGDLRNWSIDKHIRPIGTKYNDDPQQLPCDFPELIGALAPRPFLTIAPKRDDIFVLPGVEKCIQAAQPAYKLLRASDNFRVRYPNVDHDFPEAQRKAAYVFFDEVFARE